MLKSIHLQKFKQFYDTEIILSPFSILMGENNCGKTSVLQAIQLFMEPLYSKKLLNIKKKKKKETKTPNFNSGYLLNVPGISQENMASLFYAKRTGGSDEKSGFFIRVVDEHDNHILVQYKYLWHQLHFSLLSDPSQMPNHDIQEYRPLYISGFVGLMQHEERLHAASLLEKTSTGSISSIIRNIIVDIKEKSPEKYMQLQSLMQNEFRFDITNIEFIEETDLYITSNYTEIYGNEETEFDFSSSGSGIMQILQIIAIIFKFCPEQSRIVLIDEPDAHLHNNLQVRFANVLRQIQKMFNIQLIISTHSTAIIRDAETEEVIPISSLMPINKGLMDTVEKQKNIGERLDSYELGKAKISGKIAFFEDRVLDVFIALSKALGISCFNGINTIPTISGRGKDDKIPYSLFDILKEITDSEIEIHVVRDSDGLPDDLISELIDYATSRNVYIHILNRYEIENYVLSAQLIHNALKADNSRKIDLVPDIREIEVKILSILKNTVQLMEYNYTNTLASALYSIKHNLLGDNTYRPDDSQTEARSLQMKYKDLSDSNSLLKYGMGKETLGELFRWLGEEKHLSLSRKTLYSSIENDVSISELTPLFESLISTVSRHMDINTDFNSWAVKHIQLPEANAITNMNSQMSLF